MNYPKRRLVIRKRYWLKERFAEDTWTQGVIFGVMLIWLAYMTSRFTSYLTGAISFSSADELTDLPVSRPKRRKK